MDGRRPRDGDARMRPGRLWRCRMSFAGRPSTHAVGQKRSVGAEFGRGSLGTKVALPGQGCIATRLRPWANWHSGCSRRPRWRSMLTDALIVA